MTTQTFPGTVADPVALRAALRLYPARYRRERGAELSAVFADSTARAGRLATAREALDLGAYGLRMRTGLTSSSLAGRLLALAAPLIAGGIAGVGLTRGLYDALFNPGWHSNWDLPDHLNQVPHYLWYLGQVFVPLLLVAAVAVGRWRLARAAALAVASVGALGVLLSAATMQGSWLVFEESCEAAPQLFAGLLFALAPQELLERPSGRGLAVLPAALAGGGLLLVAQDFYSSFVLLDGNTAAVLLLVPAGALLFAAREHLAPAAIGLAVLPLTFLFSVFRLWQALGGMWRLLPVAGAVLLALLAAGWLLRRDAGGTGGGRSLA
ncbi:hypothetical protein ACFVVU_24075 [Kitasatospora sp. NPDC057965]|uniref:hypothetical protein n=1 Tax=Kitasatospora sp. NPDC057965 TaxID=3346291 RepID=UPI0036DB34A0